MFFEDEDEDDNEDELFVDLQQNQIVRTETKGFYGKPGIISTP